MRYVINVLVVLVTVFFLPLVYFAGEWFDILWLRIVSAVLVIPFMIWWGAYGCNLVFKKNKKDKNNKEDNMA